jgi:outer membrane protein assembly factor BamB
VLYAVTNNAQGVAGLKWSHFFGDYYYGIHAAPAIAADGTIYVSSTDGNLYAMDTLDPYDGPLWQVSIPEDTAGNVYDVTSSPVIGGDGSVCIGGSDGKLYSIQGFSGPANDQWPMWRKNNANQADAALP